MNNIYLKDGVITEYGTVLDDFIDKLSIYQREAFDKLSIEKQYYVMYRLIYRSSKQEAIDKLLRNDDNPILGINWERRNDINAFYHRYEHDDQEYSDRKKDIDHLRMSMMTREEMIVRLSEMSRTDISDLIEVTDEVTEFMNVQTGEIVKRQNIRVKDFEKMRIGAQALISEIVSDEKGIRIKFNSQLAAMQQLSKLLGYDKTTVKDINNVELPEKLTPEQKKLMGRIFDESY